MRNRTNVTPAIVASVPTVAPAIAAPAATPFRALLAQSAATVAATGRRAAVTSEFPAVDSPEFPAAVVAACESVMSRQSEPDARQAMSIVAAKLNALGVRPGRWSTGATYGTRSALNGTPMWQRDGVSMVVAAHVNAAPVEAPAAE